MLALPTNISALGNAFPIIVPLVGSVIFVAPVRLKLRLLVPPVVVKLPTGATELPLTVRVLNAPVLPEMGVPAIDPPEMAAPLSVVAVTLPSVALRPALKTWPQFHATVLLA